MPCSCVKDDYFEAIYGKAIKTMKKRWKRTAVPVTHDQLPANCFPILLFILLVLYLMLTFPNFTSQLMSTIQ